MEMAKTNPKSHKKKQRSRIMIKKNPINALRVRKIGGSFAFIEHRFLRDGFLASLNQHELLLYVFLVLAADRDGLSYYSYDKICTLLRLSVEEYIVARDALIDKNLIAFDGYLYQVLSLPQKVVAEAVKALSGDRDMGKHDPATIRRLIERSFTSSR
jgi:hypothetical protein